MVRHSKDMTPAEPGHAPVDPLPDPKRQKSNLGSALKKKTVESTPDYAKGIEYWDGIDASVDGVLGGFGNGPVPHIDQLTSRLLLLSLVPILHSFPSPLTPTPIPTSSISFRRTALDVGAGIGRVTRHTLLPLFDDVVLLEPVSKFIAEAERAAKAGEWRDLPVPLKEKPGEESEEDKAERKERERRIKEQKEGKGKRVWMVKGGLQGFDPAYPVRREDSESRGVFGESMTKRDEFGEEEAEVVYDVIWCQWCLGHLGHADLVAFLKRAQAALRPPTPLIAPGQSGSEPSSSTTLMSESLMFVKENCCPDGAWGKGAEFLDPEDSSLTRSSAKWIEIFQEAGLEIVKEEVQEGLPEELFTVKTWALK